LKHVAWLALAAVLVVNVPPFVCQGLDCDPIIWDLHARAVARGGVAYRDVCENNLPGMLWLHLGVRSAFGWRSEMLRAADVVVVAVVAWLLGRFLPRGRAWLAVGVFLFYFSTTEWCHCQRDTWMLAPALAALLVRCRQASLSPLSPVLGGEGTGVRGQQGSADNSPPSHEGFTPSPPVPLPRVRGRGGKDSSAAVIGWAFTEGLLWGAAFWIKPFVAVPALVCWLLAARQAALAGATLRRLLLDAAAVLGGGLAAGGAGVAWLGATGAWPWFVETVLVWNREYVGRDVTAEAGWLFVAGVVLRFFPWVLLHLAALPVAVRLVVAALRRPLPADGLRPALLSALYLGWLLQSVCLQHPFDYVHVPPLLLGGAVLCAHVCTPAGLPARRLLALFVVACVLVRYPGFVGERLWVWPRCWAEGSTPELRDRLSLLHRVEWRDLSRVEDYLRAEGVAEGELTCFHVTTVPVYLDAAVRPATRYVFLQNVLESFPARRGRVTADLAASGQRYVVCDLLGLRSGLRAEDLEDDTRRPAFWCPPAEPVFRSGRYVVFRLPAAQTPDWLERGFEGRYAEPGARPGVGWAGTFSGRVRPREDDPFGK
jgi:hypothetical protein